MGQMVDTSVAAGATRTGYATGVLAILGGLLLAPSIGDVLVPQSAFEFFPSVAGPLFNQPEPTEFTRYAFAAAAPVLAAAAVVIAARRGRRAERVRRAGDALAIALPMAVVAALVYVWLDRELVDPFFKQSFDYFSDFQGVLAIALAVAVAGAAAHPATRRLACRATANRTLSRLAPAGAALAMILFLLPVVQTEASFAGVSENVSTHLVSTVADVEAVANGATLGVDLPAQYSNLLPYLLAPAFEATSFEPAVMTVLLTLLTALALTAFYRVLVGVAGSAVWGLALFVPVLALSLAPSGGEGALVANDANVFQIMPIRYLGPAVVAWLLVRHLLDKRRDVGALGIFLVAGLAALSTPDFGAAAVIAASAALVLLAATSGEAQSNTLMLLRDAVLGLVAAVVIFALVTLVRSGSLPDPSVLSYYPDLYGAKGFGLVAMDTVGFHWFLYATFAGALIWAAVLAVEPEPDRALVGMLAFFSVLGLAAGVYYVGRTNQITMIALFPIWGMTLALLAWPVLRRVAAVPTGIGALRSVGVLGWLVLFGLGLATTATGWVQAPWKQVDRLLTHVDGPTAFEVDPAVAFVEPRTDSSEKVAFICRSGYLMAERAGVRNVSPIADPQALVGDVQVGEVVDALRAAGGNKLFSCQNAFFPLPPEIETGLAARGFTKSATDEAVGITEWTFTPAS